MPNHIYHQIFRILVSTTHIVCHPLRSIQNYRVRTELRTQPDTEIVIDGFPRSANSFAVLAFEKTQNRKIKIAHHNHSENEIIKGINMGIPVCVLIREPVDAIKSYILRHPEDSKRAVQKYITMYRAIEPYFDRIVIALFDDVVADFGAIIKMLNKKYGTAYKIFVNTKEECEEVFKTIRNINKLRYGGEIKYLAAPDKQRNRFLINTQLNVDGDMLIQANLLYNRYVSEAQKLKEKYLFE